MLLRLLLPLLGLLAPLLHAGVAPDVTGLVGTPYYYDTPSRGGRASPPSSHLPLKFWANPRDSALKPKRRDRDPRVLMQRMGSDFDPRWMRRTRREDKMLNISSSSLETRAVEIDERRPSVNALWEAALALQPPSTWPAPPSSVPNTTPDPISPAAWLVALGSCPAKHEWRDLGIFFWPRIVRRVECERSARTKPVAGAANAVSCGWPPGRLSCGPGVLKTLHLLRWHCRLRGTGDVWKRLAQVLKPGKPKPPAPPATGPHKSRKRYHCEWLKVPYPVPADCQCGST